MRLVLAAIALTLAAPALAAPAPKVAATSFTQLKTPLPLPYDETADAKAQVAAARARAKAQHKLLLIDLGGNWCLDCRLLAGTMELPELRSFLAKQYEIVTVDVGRFDKNLDIAASPCRLAGKLDEISAAVRTDREFSRSLDRLD